MALKDDLKALGLTDEQVSSAENVLRQHIAGEYIPKHRFDELSDKNKSLAQELGRSESEREAAEKRAKKAEDSLTPLQEKLISTESEWKQKYADLEAAHKQEEEDRITFETYSAKMDAVKKYIGDTAYDSDMITSLIDFDSLKYEDGKVSGVDKAVDQIRKERSFLFKDDSYESTAPQSAPNMEGKGLNFGEMLANRASATDAMTQAAAAKYFK